MTTLDKQFMSRALSLAKQGRFTTSPNPNVGCVIVRNGEVVGEGFHCKAGEAHAEIHALQMAGEKANGATAYVTLEPCSHYGKTPPCADALIRAGIRRVVVAMQDPNPQVAGRGLLKLQQAGIEVLHGLLMDEAEQLNQGFLKRMRTGFPYVQLKLAASLDGRTALASGESKWITSPVARQDVQSFRAQASAILTTSATVLADNPALNVRWTDFTPELQNIYPKECLRQPIRIVLDSENQVKSEHIITKSDGECWLIRPNPISQNWCGDVEQIAIPTYEKCIDLVLLMMQLAKRNINSVWVESGPTLAGALLTLGLVDELIVYIAPKILGGTAKELINIPALQKLKDAPAFEFINIELIGPDLRLTLRPL
ncbi:MULTISPECIES: bifunctional diaminohydroxyphosphoribosylaminopyrimidine deaminase/5-amino-6-(5-phosphoribosylamino)uracil reductase RibD [unclassified Arsenophonus]|uniref:bifunctional diaminohydroxyphosphoribosylaminopyrimidine deaminase/5-amino-6-(5-phosphoribosylamino)uracil reductase RibD n=1 Tax=unclassified Arsenophonus TaxID=2627083 RepID=UPI0028616182|nr:bifunctional diaminohydroxyphosphoribosylaminopyrimidine deaminase/5-amino-6-(5-phosphoribosylamino)uracil reductase RibD [Arsenophonus sp.]MDR5609419.1 bifunctional diaminohydroxyphosphoribosylaminopyrimidine deaminase/5-amino-6-(5-phosphoribosylamino)uracil reductase RibD [Arsenophonus sp.]MDR5613114.1 bifunctional diaminohydroxyphosphoribosylaminopyrimidine deaminase/5-amino-6-(5-phosphoribosylamino)uracil reductase RibD [Arsenophonus sp.]